MNVSVIITTFNRPLSLKRAVASVLNQTVLPAEIIIVNDGDELKIEEPYLLHPLIKVVQNERNYGANFSRNRGAALSRGDILMFLDDDDDWLPFKISNQVSVFEKDSELGLVYSNRNVVNEDRQLIRRITAYKSGMLYPEILFTNIIGTTSSVAVKKEIFNEVGGFDQQLEARQDFDLWIRICERCTVGLDKSYSVNYAVASDTSGQISGSGPKKKRSVEYILKKYHDRIDRLSFWEKQKLKSNYSFYISKSYRSQSWTESFRYAMISFCRLPNLKAVALMLPDKLLKQFLK